MRVPHGQTSCAATDIHTTQMVVHHFGPDPRTVGGMATVIRTLTDHSVGGDIVNSHATWRPRSPVDTARLFAGSTRALLQVPSPHIAHVHLSEGGSFLREGSLVALASRRGLVTIATIHGARFTQSARRLVWISSGVLRRADLVTCLDEEALALVRGAAPHVHSEMVPNPVLVEDGFSAADETDELVLFAGEIGTRKGADVLHRAWQLVLEQRPNARCVMVGPAGDFSPPRAERLEVRASVDAAEINELLRDARVIALPSRAEGMPMVLTEAMSVGRPFVGTPVGGVPELAAEGGMLAEVGDAAGLADRLTALLADPALARRIGERGRRFCLQTRSVEILDARWRELYARAGDAHRER
jgi:glycosyltransferase involved in cell wall biosynthesis